MWVRDGSTAVSIEIYSRTFVDVPRRGFATEEILEKISHGVLKISLRNSEISFDCGYVLKRLL